MARNKDEDAPVLGASEQQEFPLGIEEWCTQVSRNDQRVEMLGAFCAAERAAKRVKDLPSAYAARLTAFASAPVEEV